MNQRINNCTRWKRSNSMKSSQSSCSRGESGKVTQWQWSVGAQLIIHTVLFPIKGSEVLCQLLGAGHGGCIYTMEISKFYKESFFLWRCDCQRTQLGGNRSTGTRSQSTNTFPTSLLTLTSSKASFIPKVVYQALEYVPSLTSLQTTDSCENHYSALFLVLLQQLLSLYLAN